MKIALIIPCNIWFAPFVNIYTRILEEHNIRYDIISWNKEGNEDNTGLQYEKSMNTNSQISKFIQYIKFASFVKRVINKNKYDKLIIFTSQAAIFMHKFLERKYKNRYIFDFRDLSIEQSDIFKGPMKNVLKNSYSNVVSSPGFLKCLPKDFKYYLSHNFNIEIVKKVLQDSTIIPFKKMPYNILTIGGIRDYDSNIEVVDALANKKNVTISFVGRGPASESIKQYVNDNKIDNADFVGFYKKEDEAGYVQESTFMNIYYPSVITHDTALSNRFYNALIYKKPMIVKTNSIQGDYVEKYNLGLSLSNCENLHKKIQDFLDKEDNKLFNESCNNLLKEFKGDYDKFFEMIHNFVLC